MRGFYTSNPYMARTQFSAAVYDEKHKSNLPRLRKRLQSIYDKLADDIAAVAASTKTPPGQEVSLADFPVAQRKVERLLNGLATEVQSLITDGVDQAWDLSFEKNSAMIAELATRYGFSKERAAQLSKRNLAALATFKTRREKGMNLSERVWDFVKNDRMKMELAMEVGIAEGKSAAALSRDVRSYLKEPNKLFRRVRKTPGGPLRLSKAAAAYHPGQGVYRSSYKNALRMTITETNMAYRAADNAAWQNMPFVTGVIIKLSGSHPVYDMCDELSGVYPPEFKFTGWHAHCICYAIAKLASREELRKYCRLSDADQAHYEFEGKVKEMPKAFTDWIDTNAERIARAKNMPYFIRDNYLGGRPGTGWAWQTPAASAGVVPPFEFVPAQSLEDAQIFAQQFCADRGGKKLKGQVDYTGMELEMANAINEALARAFNDGKLKPLAGVRVVSGRGKLGQKMLGAKDALTGYQDGGLFINRDHLGSREAWDAAKVKGYADNTPGGIISHRLGDKIRLEDTPAAVMKAAETNMATYAGKISTQAGKSLEAYFAESVAAYMKGNGRIIDPALRAHFDTLGLIPRTAMTATPAQIKTATTLQKAAQRHANRTADQVKAIKDRWAISREKAAQAHSREAILAKAKARQAARTEAQIQDIKDRWALRQDEMQYTPEQRRLFRELEAYYGIKRGFSMPYLRADQQSANPNYGKKGYNINCATCSPTYILRTWGFDVTAKANLGRRGTATRALCKERGWAETWLEGNFKTREFQTFGDFMKRKGYREMDAKKYEEFFNASCKKDGLYELVLTWRGGGGHATIIERKGGKLKYIEPQVNNAPGSRKEHWDMKYICENMSYYPVSSFGIVSTKDAIFNKKYWSAIQPNATALSLRQQRVQNAAAERHALRTDAQIKDIKKRWGEYKERRKIDEYIKAFTEATTIKALNDSVKVTRKALGGVLPEKARKAYIDHLAEIRHAARNDKAVQDAWTKRREEYAAIRKEAGVIYAKAKGVKMVDKLLLSQLNDKRMLENHVKDLAAVIEKVKEELQRGGIQRQAQSVLKLAEDYPYLETKKLQTALGLGDETLIRREITSLSKQIAYERSITPPEIRYSQMVAKFGEADAKAALDNSARTMKKYEKDSVDTRISKYKYEADWIRKNRSFATKEAVAKIYEREAQRLEDIRKFDEIKKRATEMEATLKDLGVKTEKILTGKETTPLYAARIQKRVEALNKVVGKLEDAKRIIEYAKTSKDAGLKDIAKKISSRIKRSGAAAQLTKLNADAQARIAEIKREEMIARYGNYNPNETIEEMAARLGSEMPKTLKELGDAEKVYKYRDAALAKDAVRIEEHMKKMFADNDLGMDISGDLLSNIIDKGFFNTFQSGTSGGYKGSSKTTGKIESTHKRLGLSHRMFTPSTAGSCKGYSNYNGPQFERKDYEKYGHVLDRDKYVALTENCTWYGSNGDSSHQIQVRFKRNEVCATWSANDTLNITGRGRHFQPSLVTDPKVSSFDECGFDAKRILSENGVKPWQRANGTSYIELQYHGQLTIDNVESITFKMNPEKFVDNSIIKQLNDKGIELWYLDGKKVVQYKP